MFSWDPFMDMMLKNKYIQLKLILEVEEENPELFLS